MALLVGSFLAIFLTTSVAQTTNKLAWIGKPPPTAADDSKADFPKGFIKTWSTGFVDEKCREFVPVGWNAWNDPMLFQAMAAAQGKQWGAKYVDDTFAAAKKMGFNTMRIFGFGIENMFTLQRKPGVYNETVFRGFDFVLHTCAKYNIRVIWAMTTNWQKADGVYSYIDWADIEPDQFWVDKDAQRMFKDHLSTVVNRVNHFNNRTYKEDPTIMSWNLYNEMRCPQNQSGFEAKEWCKKSINNWIRDMAQYLKDEDPFHLVTVGNEGFFDWNSTLSQYNPSGVPDNVYVGWSAYVGQDFESNHKHPDIDYAGFHMWPDNWRTLNLSWASEWIDAHIVAAQRLKKPVLLQEYGKRAYPGMSQFQRDPWFDLIHDRVTKSIRANDYFKGSILWYWDPFNWVYNDGVSKQPNQPLPPTAAVVQPQDTTWGLLEAHADNILSMTGTWRGSDCDKALLGYIYPDGHGPDDTKDAKKMTAKKGTDKKENDKKKDTDAKKVAGR